MLTSSRCAIALLFLISTGYRAMVSAADLSTPAPMKQSLNQMLEECAARSSLPKRYFYHLESQTSFDPPTQDSSTGSVQSANVYRDDSRIDIARKTAYIKEGRAIPNYAFRDLWDGKRFYHRQQGIFPGAHEMIVSTSRESSIDVEHPLWDQCLEGKLPSDGLPVASIVERCGNGRIAGMEEVDGKKCMVVEASTKSGLYRLWIDTNAGYLLRKFHVEKHPGDLVDGKPLRPKKDKDSISDIIVTVDQVTTGIFEGQTIVTSARTVEKFGSGIGTWGVNTEHLKRSRISLHPDFTAKKAFVMDGIPENTPIYVRDRSPNDHLAYIWKDGGVRVDDDKLAGKLIDEVIQNEKNAKK